jgi:phosphoribosyl-ATP pyrophosphohydrolase
MSTQSTAESILQRVSDTIASRKGADAGTSYVASLYSKGLDTILKKLGEEATETVIAAKGAAAGEPKEALVKEVADLWFHSLIALGYYNLSAADVLRELERREGTSGHAEKAARG